jgi:hypothetical protein
MQNNIKPAVLIIAILSLLLGLSIGQHYRQYRYINALESRTLNFSPVQIHINRNHCSRNFNAVQAEIEARRAEIEAIKAQMRQDRELQLEELREQIEQVREQWTQRR